MLTALPTELEGLWEAYRQTDIDPRLPVFWREGSQRRPVEQESGRWHTRGEGYAQYMSLTVRGAWAEFVRSHDIRTENEAVETHRNMYRCYVAETRIADLRTPAAAQRVGLDPLTLVGPHEPCRVLARALRAEGFRGVLSPSAALEGELNLTLFGARDENHLLLGDSFDGRYVSQDVVEVQTVASGAQPLLDLLGMVRAKEESTETYNDWPSEGYGLPRRLATGQ